MKLDCHISYQKNHYSCPYQYVKKKVDLKVTHDFLEIYFQDERIATHKSFPQYKEYAFSTSPEHLPDQFNQLEWNDQRLLNWGLKIGPYTHKVIQRVLENLLLKEQGYQSCLSILNLSKKYSNAALETACQVALEKVYSPKYRQLNSILTNPANNKTMENAQSTYTESMGFVRGSDYYGGKHNDK